MTSQPVKIGAFIAGGVMVLSGCAATGTQGSPAPRPATAAKVAQTRPAPVASETRGETPPGSASTPAPTTMVSTEAPDIAEPSTPARPVVTIRGVTDGTATINDGRPCSNASAASLAPGALEVHRTGSLTAPLTVRYTIAGPASGDIEALPSEITIPAGMASASVRVMPSMSHAAAPVHVHRSNAVALTLTDTDTYDVGVAATAEITVRIDIDLFGCEQPSPTEPAPLAVLPLDT